MLLLASVDPKLESTLFVVIGMGMIGSAVARRLEKRFSLKATLIPNYWNQVNQEEHFSSHVAAIESQVQAMRRENKSQSVQIYVVWSAGAAGFAATEEQAMSELASYRSALSQFARIENFLERSDRLSFCLLSSVGGLFEGSRLLTGDAPPSPTRPYGFLKFAQEQELSRLLPNFDKLVIRLTSVYGYLRATHRPGVVGTMLLNGLQQRVTPISGRMNTLRDFVWIEDLADAVVDLLLAAFGSRDTTTLTLASAKPYSLLEVRTVIEQVLGRKLYLAFRLAADNAQDITVGSGRTIRRLHSDSFFVNVGKMYSDLVTRGLRV